MPLKFTMPTTAAANPPAAQPTPAIAAVRREVTALQSRIEKGQAWLRANPQHVTWEPGQQDVKTGPLDASPDEHRYRALTPSGQTILALYQALVNAHRMGVRILAGDALIAGAEARQDDDAAARYVEQITIAWAQWDTAHAQIEMIEAQMSAQSKDA